MGRGWHFDSYRHNLARLGIRSSSSVAYDLRRMQALKGEDSQKNIDPLHPEHRHKFHDLIQKILRKKKEEPIPIETKKQLDKAIVQIKTVDSHHKLREWLKEHRYTLEVAGLMGLFIALALITKTEFTSGLYRNIHTGEIVRMGSRTLLQSIGYLGTATIGALLGGVGMEESVVSEEEKNLRNKIRAETDPEKGRKLMNDLNTTEYLHKHILEVEPLLVEGATEE